MTTTTTHTPTPWHVNTKIRNKIYVEAASAFICDMQADEQGDTIENFAAIDAAHLVRCVNEREELLNTLRMCLQDLERWKKSYREVAGYGHGTVNTSTNEVITHVRAVLARAEQEEG